MRWPWFETHCFTDPIHQHDFQAVDEPTYQAYLWIFHHLRIMALDMQHTSSRACFVGIAVNRNNCILPHKDVNDFKDRWAAMYLSRGVWAVMCCFEEFTGGEELMIKQLIINAWEGCRWGTANS